MKSNFKSFIRKRFYKLFPELKKLCSNDIVNSKIGKHTKVYPASNIINSEIGDYTYISQNSKISLVNIGKFCSIGPNFIAGWGIHPTHGISTHPMFYSLEKQNGITITNKSKLNERKPIIIGNDVFIGMNVIVLDGVTIGDGAVIGAGAVVSKDISPYSIAVGNPIKVMNQRFDEASIRQLQKIKWWNRESSLKDIENLFFDVQSYIQTHIDE
ncbi:CatB-related O-acetyltransferase [uncultured Winogradskyella sp.]|uniref:CatB-related O-acetyltransferase n=1 Tax=uncultured Winogradskyella sp. TaxID=395353 RepID=UPI0030D793E6|tara:strand:+ start:11198 stop:11836 length:639 start_codon:yes stop_codon:yes gene_type:complete